MKITVILLQRHVALLDRLALDIRIKHGQAITRSEIIFAMVEAAERRKMDPSALLGLTAEPKRRP
jgi:hypothetical protein